MNTSLLSADFLFSVKADITFFLFQEDSKLRLFIDAKMLSQELILSFIILSKHNFPPHLHHHFPLHHLFGKNEALFEDCYSETKKSPSLVLICALEGFPCSLHQSSQQENKC